MDLTETQQTAITSWVEEGADLGEIQSRLKTELDISLTYLDTRFLLGDLGLELAGDKEDEPPAETPSADDTPPEAGTAAPTDNTGDNAGDTPPDSPAPGAGGSGLSVTIDQITQPHAVVSGRVNFSDGESAAWYLDQMGRLGLDPSTEDYQPSEQDLAEFQLELQNVLRQKGL